MRNQIFSIATHYQAVGFLSGAHEYDDVNAGADFLENNPYIEFADRRRTVEGILQGVLNSAVSDANGSIFSIRQDIAQGVLPDDVVQPEIHDAFFYGELIEKIERFGRGWHLVFAVDDVLVGYPEHVVAGQSRLRINFDFEEGNEFAITDLEIGERYFLRGTYNATFSPVSTGDVDTISPTVGDEYDILQMQPLYPDGAWYIQVPYGETVDFTLPEWEAILEEAALLHHNHHSVQLRTTADMTLMPIMLPEAEMGYMVEGRPIDQKDNQLENPVAVIHANFAHIRDLNIGDMITVKIPQRHDAEYEHSWTHATNTGTQTFSDVRVESRPQTEEMQEIELEIVGIFNLFEGLGGDLHTSFSTHVYIPDSILPDDVLITSNRWGNSAFESYLPSTWYSFMLGNSRDELAFIAQNRLPLEEMGLTLTMISSAQNFWEAADIILQSMIFNTIVFSVVLMLVLILVIFLFLRQRRKEFIVSRMLGYSNRQIVGEVLITATLSLLPIIMGSICAYFLARSTVMNTLQDFEALQSGYEAVFSLSFFGVMGLMALVFILAMLMVLIGAIHLTRRPVLELLQKG